MSLNRYFPLSVLLFAAVVAVTRYFAVPTAPFALILLAAETLVGFQLEDHKIPKFLHEVFRAPKHHAH
jgi:hypothetical protein